MEGLERDDAPLLINPVHHNLPAALVDHCNHSVLVRSKYHIVDDSNNSDVHLLDEGKNGDVEVFGEGVIVVLACEGLGGECVGGINSEGVVSRYIEKVGGMEVLRRI